MQAKPKELWKTLKSLGLLSKTFSCKVSALKAAQQDTNLVLEGFKDYFSTFLGHIFKKLPKINIA